MVKFIAFILLCLVVFNLFKGLKHLLKGESSEKQVVKSLTYRVIFSVCLLVFLVVAALMGWIQPHGVDPNRVYHAPGQNPSSVDTQDQSDQ